jgi:hypothetical protein
MSESGSGLKCPVCGTPVDKYVTPIAPRLAVFDERDEAARKAIEAFAWRIVQQAAETTQRSFQVIFEAELEKVREAKDE